MVVIEWRHVEVVVAIARCVACAVILTLAEGDGDAW
jgi:hypothetical protein